MPSPALLSRVRVSGREDEFIVVRVDRLARVADICALFDQTTIERGVPFDLLSPTSEPQATNTDYLPHDERISVVHQAMRGSYSRLNKSHAAVADIQEMIRVTLDMIHTSQKLIVASDHVITRAQYGSIDDEPEPVPIS